MKYWYPKFDGSDFYFFRIGGPTLGNLLFPYARAIIEAEKWGGVVIQPTWPQFKPKRFVTLNRDQRGYSKFFVPGLNEVSGLNKLKTLILNKKFACDYKGNHGVSGVIEVSGMGEFFNDFVGYEDIVRREIMSRMIFEDNSVENDVFCAIHVRMGDFAVANKYKDRIVGKRNERAPMEWYLSTVEAIRSEYKDIKILVFSDGTAQELDKILSLNNVVLSKSISPVDDLYKMTKAKVFVGSSSTFSYWACFLGDMKAIFPMGSFDLMPGVPTNKCVEIF